MALAGGFVWLFLLGFLFFANTVMRDEAVADQRGDGIVVLTGGPTRIAEGARLLQEGRAKRLLISGINVQTNRESVQKLASIPKAKFDCCVDLGYEALDTAGNANETRSWVESRGYRRIVVVTSSVHMPRSLAELQRELPLVEFVPHPVRPKNAGERPWWLQPHIARTLAWEYLKFLPSAARLVVSRVLDTIDGSSVAEGPDVTRSRT